MAEIIDLDVWRNLRKGTSDELPIGVTLNHATRGEIALTFDEEAAMRVVACLLSQINARRRARGEPLAELDSLDG